MAWGGDLATHIANGLIRELTFWRNGYASDDATESGTLGIHQETKIEIKPRSTKDINDIEYQDVWDHTITVADLETNFARLRSWMLFCKDYVGVGVKTSYPGAYQYWNYIPSGASPVVPVGSQPMGLGFDFSLGSNTDGGRMNTLTFNCGMKTPQMEWMANNSATLNAGGALTLLPIIVDPISGKTFAQRYTPGIVKITIGGVDIGRLTPRCKFGLKTVVMDDRKNYDDTGIPSWMTASMDIEIQQDSLPDEIKQVLADSYGFPPIVATTAKNETITWEAGSTGITPTISKGDKQNHLGIKLSRSFGFNTIETTPDTIDLGLTSPLALVIKA